MATIPPWLNVSPSDFLRAMQAGATAGLQVADLRQRGSLEADRLAQSAAIAAANRSAAAQAQANSLAFQEWERGELGRQAAEQNARQERVAMAGLEQRGLEAGLERQLEMARDLETGRHQKAMEETARGRLDLGKAKLEADLNRLKERLNIPARHHMTTIEGKVIATDPITGKSFIAWPPQAVSKKVTDESGAEILDQPFDLKNLDPRLIQGPFGGPLPPGPFSSSSPGSIPMLPPPSTPAVEKYLYRDGKLVRAK